MVSTAWSADNGVILSNAGDIVVGNFPVGFTTITFSVEDCAGNTASCLVGITVTDTQVPNVINCPQTQTVNLSAGNCEEPVSLIVPVANDNCGITSVTYQTTGATQTSGNGFPSVLTCAVGTTNVTYTIMDAAGLTAGCSFNITVTQTTTYLTCPQNMELCIDEAPFALTGANRMGGTYNGPGVVDNIFYPQTAGTGMHTITYSIINQDNGCTFTCNFSIQVNGSTSNTTQASACNSYTWSANGTTYASSGIYEFKEGCHTEILELTITPITTNTVETAACDSYTWSVNGSTYTTSGTYEFNAGCHTEVLVLTITPITTNTVEIAACDSYIWSVNSTTYTTSGTYEFTAGCHTEVLVLTITSSTSNTTQASACNSYIWATNGQTYTQSGTYEYVEGCATYILQLQITACASDLVPTVPEPANSLFTEGQQKEGIIQITNIGNEDATGLITFTVSIPTNFTLEIPEQMMTAAGQSVQNSQWTITPGSFIYTISATTQTIQQSGGLRIGYTLTAGTNQGGTGIMTVTVLQQSGGENNASNNVVTKTFAIY
jgi:hypothetical protein